MKIIGIDLGTTNSVVCRYHKGNAEVVPIADNVSVPSVIFIDNEGPQVGTGAKQKSLIYPDQILSSTKRELGREWKKTILGKDYAAKDAAQMILSFLKENAETQLNDKLEKVVITVPAYFTSKQRAETLEAAHAAGFEVLRLLPEPTAAAIAYGFDHDIDQTILVIDLGGGTLDISILAIEGNDFVVKGLDGNNYLGGDDFDLAIVEYLNNWVEDNYEVSPRSNNIAQQKLKELAEDVKISLSATKSTEVFMTDLLPGVNIDIERFTRKTFQVLIQPYLDEIKSKIESAMSLATLSMDDINRFVLVGGSCKHPVVQDYIELNYKAPFISENMDTAVAKGAAIYCHSLLMPDVKRADMRPVELKISDAISHSYGVDMITKKGNLILLKKPELAFIPILDKNTHYPCQGAVIGFADPWQPIVKMRVFRGEHTDLDYNEYLGELIISIDKKHIGDNPNAVVAIFELDINMILSFTAVEVPLNSTTQKDLAPLLKDAKKDNGRISVSDIQSLITKHSFRTRKTEITLK